MKKGILKRTIAIIVSVVMLASITPSVYAARETDFVDFPSGWSHDAVKAAVDNGLLTGRSANEIEPQGNLTRAEMATIINRAFGATIEADISHYTDVNKNEWYYHEIAKAVNMQTFEGNGDATMRPDAPITREEVFAVIARSLVLESNNYSSLDKFGDSADFSDWAKKYAAVMAGKSYVNGNELGNACPKNYITREEFAQIMYNIIKTYYTSAGTYSESGAVCSLIRTTDVTLSNVTINGDLIVGDGVGNGNVKLNNVTIKGRLLCRGGEKAITLKNTTVGEIVVIKDVNGIVHFENYKTEAPFTGINELTPATFLQVTVKPGGGSSSGGGGSVPSKTYVTYTTKYYLENAAGTYEYKEEATSASIVKGTDVKADLKSFVGYELNTAMSEGIADYTAAYSGLEFKVYYQRCTYTVNITMPNGTVQTYQYKYNEVISKYIDLGSQGTDVTFYYVDPYGNEIEITENTPITADVTILSRKSVSVQFNSNFGSGDIVNIKVTQNDKIGNRFPAIMRAGYVLAQWNTQANASGLTYDANTAVAADVILYAIWTPIEYTITYHSDFAFDNPTSVVSKYTVETSDTYLPTATAFTNTNGYTFEGWYTDAAYTDKITYIAHGTMKNINVYAKWTPPAPVEYSVKFDYNYGLAGIYKTVTVVSGNKIVPMPSAPSRETGYGFGGWFREPGCTTAFNENDLIESDLTLYAKWIPFVYKITYNSAIAFKADAAITKNYTIETPTFALPNTTAFVEDSTKIFEGWYLDPDYQTSITEIAKGTTGNITVYAKWKNNIPSVTYYDVTFDYNYDSLGTYTTRRIESGTKLDSAMPTSPARTGYTFGGWYTSGNIAFTKDSTIQGDITVYAKWTINEYWVTFKENYTGGGSDIVRRINYNETIGTILPSNPIRTGYTFDGWYTAGGAKINTATTVTDTLTVYAHWTIQKFDVVFNESYVGASDYKVINTEYGSSLGTNMPSNPVQIGHSFAGWYDENGKKFDANTVVTAAVTLTARWTVNQYSVTFKENYDGGAADIRKSTDYNTAFGSDFPADPVRTGYHFDGWFDASNRLFDKNTAVIANITVYAHWTVNSYRVDFNESYTGAGDATYIHVNYGSTAGTSMPENPERTGYHFDGWYDGNGTQFTYTTTVLSNITLTARWSKMNYTLTFDYNYTGSGASTIKHADYDTALAADFPEQPSRSGYAFQGWFDSNNNEFTATTKVTASKTLYAKWQINIYTVTFNENYSGGGSNVTKDVQYGSALSDEMIADPQRIGFTFVGWFTSDHKPFTKATPVTDSLTVYAQWSTNAYSVKFNESYAGASDETTINVTYNTEIGNRIPQPSRTGFTFDGWFTAENEQITDTTVVTKAITASARWTINTYDVTFAESYVGADDETKRTVNYGATVGAASMPQNPQWEGHTFTGWFTDTNTAFTADTIITNSLTVYAHWEINSYSVKFNESYTGANDETAINVTYNTEIGNRIPQPSRPGFTFDGWFTAENEQITDATVVTKAITASAKWTINTYDVTFAESYVGAGDETKRTVNYGATVGVASMPQNPQWAGHTFAGWVTSNNTPFTANTVVTAPVTVYAHWTVNTYRIDFNESYTGAGDATYITVDYGSAAGTSMPQNPVRTGYDFVGWYDTSDVVFTNTTTVTDNVTLTARWTKQNYTLTFDYNYIGSPVNIVKHADYDTALAADFPSQPSRTGYTFLGWFDSNDSEFTAVTKVTESKVLTAKWQVNIYTVTFKENYSGCGSNIVKDVAYGSVLADNMVSDPQRTGYTFVGWYTEDNTPFTNATVVTESLTVKAHWSTNAYRVQFNESYVGAGDASSINVEYNTEIGDRVPQPSRPGFTFDGWFTAENEQITDTTVVTKAITASAKWTINTYDVTFAESYVGADDETKRTVNYGATIGTASMPQNPQWAGHTFVGWFTSDNTPFTANTVVTASVTVSARWTVNTYKIDFNESYTGANDASSISVDYNTKIGDTIPKPTRTGFTFDGWYTENDVQVTAETVVTENMTVHAKWSVITFKVTFAESYTDADDATERTVNYGTSIGSTNMPAVPVRANYNFVRWYTADGADFTATTTVNSNITVYTEWTQVITYYKVSFYEGAVADEDYLIRAKTVVSGSALSDSDISSALSGFTPYVYRGYVDGSYTHRIYPELWYQKDDGTWDLFDSSVAINKDTNVFYSFKKLGLSFKLKFGSIQSPMVSFSVPYQSDTRAIDTVKDAMTLGRNQINLALNTEDAYAEAIAEAAGKSNGLLDANGNIKILDVETKIINIIKADEIDAEIKKYITDVITSSTDRQELESVILMVSTSEIASLVPGGYVPDVDTVINYIYYLRSEDATNGTNTAGDFATQMYGLLKDFSYYQDFISSFKNEDDTFNVTCDNVNFVKAVAVAVNDYTYDNLKNRIRSSFGPIIDLIGDEAAEEFMRDAQDRYYQGALDLWDEIEYHRSMNDLSYATTYDAFLTFKLNVITQMFKPVYEKSLNKTINKFTATDKYRYSENTYLQQLVNYPVDDLLGDMFVYSTPSEGYTGYALYARAGGESGYMHYYDYALQRIILMDKAMLWYKDILSDAEIAQMKDELYVDFANDFNRMNTYVENYLRDGSLPLGLSINSFNNLSSLKTIMDTYKGKIDSAANRYTGTDLYGKDWTPEKIKTDLQYGNQLADMILGLESPVFTADTLMNSDQPWTKFGFTDYSYTGDADEGTVTIQAIERNLRDNYISIRRYFN